MFALAATALALVVGGLAAFALARRDADGRPRGRGFDALLLLPLGTSAVTVGFGFLIALDRPPLDLRASPWLVPIAQALIAAPFVAWVLLPVLRAIDPRLRDAASVLGASPARVWREVDLPIAARALLVAAGFAFAISLGEFGATLFVARPDYPTLPVVIYRLLGLPGRSTSAPRWPRQRAPDARHRGRGPRHRALPRRHGGRVLIVLELVGIEVRFGDVTAVDGVDLTVADGEILSRARTERQRQEHVAAGHRRPRATRAWPGGVGRT